MPAPTRCDCGDSECRSCGTAQGTRTPADECTRCGAPLVQDERDVNRDVCHDCADAPPALNASHEHYTDGRPCWCGPRIEHGHGDDGDVIIHRDKEEAH